MAKSNAPQPTPSQKDEKNATAIEAQLSDTETAATENGDGEVETEPKVEKPSDISADVATLHAAAVSALGLPTKLSPKLHARLWTFASRFRQPRKDDGKCNKTPFFTRWDTNPVKSHLTVEDPRYASMEECERVYCRLLSLVLEAEGAAPCVDVTVRTLASARLGREIAPGSLKCADTNETITADDIKAAIGYSTPRLGHYDVPTTYIKQLTEKGRHEASNVAWMKPLHIIYKLRTKLQEELLKALGEAPDKMVASARKKSIKKVLDKIQVKAYCTDKVTMPPFYSNRDVRWATWATDQGSDKTFAIQYASHRDCAMIELELMAQLFEFASAPNLPDDLATELKTARGEALKATARMCFITGKVLDFAAYAQGAIDAKGGRSKYHVGHVTPLTRGGRHEYENIEWTSDDGNRIQGNDTLEEIEAKLFDAVIFHLQRDAKNDHLPVQSKDKLLNLAELVDATLKRLP
jgi:hypothetical protein